MGRPLGRRALLLGALSPDKIGAPHRLRGLMHILIADDDPVAQEICRQLLEHFGHTVVGVPDGAAALIALAQEPFDVVFLDLRMPRLDGIAVVRAINTSAPIIGSPRLIALSAGIDDGDEATLLAQGFHAYLLKPMRVAALRQLLTDLAA